MKFLISLLIAAASSVSVAYGATAFCDGICEEELGVSCNKALETFEFSGDCCSLQEAADVGGNCTLVITTQCYYQVKGATGCTTEPDGSTSCVVPGVDFSSNSDAPCPASVFEIPMIALEDDSGTTMPNATDKPTETTETVAPTEIETDKAPSSATRLSLLGVAGAAFLVAQSCF